MSSLTISISFCISKPIMFFIQVEYKVLMILIEIILHVFPNTLFDHYYSFLAHGHLISFLFNLAPSLFYGCDFDRLV